MGATELLDAELVMLDGRAGLRLEVQKAIDDAKERLRMVAALPSLPPTLAAFVADVVRCAQETGRLGFMHESIAYCAKCGKSGGYAKHKRSGWSRSKGSYSKGQDDRSKPLDLSAVDLSHNFIRIRHHVSLGCCWECWETVKPSMVKALETIRAEIPKHITGVEPRFKWYQHSRCTKCNWLGHEGQLLPLRAILGGSYPGECPECHAQNLPFGEHLIKGADGWTVVESPR